MDPEFLRLTDPGVRISDPHSLHGRVLEDTGRFLFFRGLPNNCLREICVFIKHSVSASQCHLHIRITLEKFKTYRSVHLTPELQTQDLQE